MGEVPYLTHIDSNANQQAGVGGWWGEVPHLTHIDSNANPQAGGGEVPHLTSH